MKLCLLNNTIIDSVRFLWTVCFIKGKLCTTRPRKGYYMPNGCHINPFLKYIKDDLCK